MDDVQIWAMDNGVFTGRYPGDDAYMAALTRYAAHQDRCMFVVAPDVLYNAGATLERFPGMATRLRQQGWPVALVGQDGMEHHQVPWHLSDWLFIGGSTAWKLGAGAAALSEQAHAHGKRVHVGRVNSARRMRHAITVLGADSCDGTYLAYGPHKNVRNVLAWARMDMPMLPGFDPRPHAALGDGEP